MSLNLKNIVGDIFHTEEKEKAEEAKKQADLLQKVNATYGIKEAVSNGNTFNPFLKKDGSLFNPYMDYQRVLDNPNVSQAAKKYISQATGLTQKVFPTVQSGGTQSQVSGQTANVVPQTGNTTPQSTNASTEYVGTGEFKNSVGKRITDTSKYNNGAAKGQCVWYVLGRASERNGKNIQISGNANELYKNANSNAVLSATPENLKGNMLLCYSKGTSTAGQKYGHVIFIEDVVGDTVYYTEGGSGYYKNKTDGVVKTGTKQQILSGVNSSGARIGSGAAGLVDLSKY